MALPNPSDEFAGLRVAPETEPIGVIRYEQRLHVDTDTIPTHRVRVQKYVVTEERMIPVTIRREEIRVTEEALDSGGAANPQHDGGTEGEEMVTVILSEERPVISWETVPVERVFVRRHTVTTSREHTGTVLLEHVEVRTDLPGHASGAEQGAS